MARILITNDDGVQAPGILALRQALEQVAEVMVFAPSQAWSASGHTKTMHKPLRIWQTTMTDGTTAYVSNGAPSDCVGLAALDAIPFKPDLVVSGINSGANIGTDLTYSGTVAAALEAIISGLPAMSVSLDSYDHDADYGFAASVAAMIAVEVLSHGLPDRTMLNVNVPALPASKVKGVRVTRQGKRVYEDVALQRNDLRGRPYYWVGGDAVGIVEDGTDVEALSEAYVSVTPLRLDMTAYGFMDQLHTWGLDGLLDSS